MFKGKHAAQDAFCRKTWGTCDVRSNQPDAFDKEKILPHVCADILPHLDGMHHCSAPGCSSSSVLNLEDAMGSRGCPMTNGGKHIGGCGCDEDPSRDRRPPSARDGKRHCMECGGKLDPKSPNGGHESKCSKPKQSPQRGNPRYHDASWEGPRSTVKIGGKINTSWRCTTCGAPKVVEGTNTPPPEKHRGNLGGL